MNEDVASGILLWMSITLLVMALAMNKNRSPFWWGVLTALLPPVGLMLILLIEEY